MNFKLGILPFLGGSAIITLNNADNRIAQPTGLTIHEWGTFTSIAGKDGMAVDWQPLDGPTDLPCFVYRFEHGAKGNLGGTVRMETPVIYFYGPGAASADVRVTFPNGFITEWYPRANRVATFIGSGMPRKGPDVRQPRAHEPDSIEWSHVELASGSPTFPFEFPSSHYYAARSTDATPLLVGKEKEKFLFYRGVGRFQPPIAVLVNQSEHIVARNLSREPIPATILFENLDGRISYRVHGPIDTQFTFDATQPAGGVAALKTDMEHILVDQGLFPKEAKAMVATWSDSWFEEGTRLFYFLQTPQVDRILPLEIQPAPAQISRVFVGRVEVYTPSTKKMITDSLTRGDWRPLAKYGRFLEPIVSEMGPGPWTAQLYRMRDQYIRRETACGGGSW